MQIDIIMKNNCLVSFLIHPDYIIDKRARDTYRALLSYLRQLRSEQRLWFALPGEVDQWWRARSKMRVIRRGGQWRIEGAGAERAKLAFAKVSGDHLEYEIDTQPLALEVPSSECHGGAVENVG
jgi:hypothetical protein